jgi:hypothetical protein
MNKLEAQALIENSGNYDEEEIEDVLDVYEELIKNVGFEDNRRDNRYIVKFHDIFYYMPDEAEAAEEVDGLFENFCYDQAEMIEDELKENNIDIDSMLTNYDVGHYRAFLVDIPEITKENAADLAMEIYDEFNYKGKDYVKNYIYTVNLLQDLEDNYMDYWIEFLELNEIQENIVKEIKEKYKKDQQRRKNVNHS